MERVCVNVSTREGVHTLASPQERGVWGHVAEGDSVPPLSGGTQGTIVAP